MDPLERLTEDIHELIFQHFDERDILGLSTVSKAWYDSIGSSKKCMSKVEFALKFQKKSSNTRHQQIGGKINLVKETTRRYQNITINCCFDRTLSAEFWCLLEFLSSNLVNLKIKSIKLESYANVNLPKLEFLKLTYVSSHIRDVLLKGTSILKKLVLKKESPVKWNMACRRGITTGFSEFCQKNNRLKELELHGAMQYVSSFEERISVVRFQLTSLKVKTDMRLTEISEKSQENFISFLNTQQHTLENISVDVCLPKVIQHIFNNMPSLKSIHVDVVITNQHFKVRDLKLRLNEHVVELKIPYVTEHDDIIEFLNAAPNLMSLFVVHLSHETMAYVAWNLRYLKKLQFRYDEIDCAAYYERLKSNHPDVNQDITFDVDFEYR